MAIVPDKRIEKVQFFENHNAQWNTNATAIGTTTADVTALATKTTAARTAYAAQQAALQAAKDATAAFYNAVDAMAVAGAAIIKQVRAKAESTANPNVYVLAGLPVPTPPAPRGNPGTPFDFTAQLHQDGSVELAWKCRNPGGGVLYQVYRSVAGSGGEFTYLGGTGQRRITDTAIPTGAVQLTYKIQAVRTNAVGNWATFNVGFGAGGAQPVAAGVEAVTPVRRAA